MKKYIMTVHPRGGEGIFTTQAFTTVFCEAESAEDAKKQAEAKDLAVWTIYEAASSMGQIIKFLNERIDKLKVSLHLSDSIHEAYARVYLKAMLDAYEEIYDIARGKGIARTSDSKEDTGCGRERSQR